jgi:hypothetical protein
MNEKLKFLGMNIIPEHHSDYFTQRLSKQIGKG